MATLLPLETDPQDVAIAADGDIEIGPEGLRLVFGIEAVVQAVRFRLQFYRAEWFLNMGLGIAYYEELLGDASKIPGIEARAISTFRAVILGVPNIVEVLSLEVKVDRTTRKMAVSWQARTQFGDTPTDLLEV
jgi:hypothetical protein